MKILNFNSQKKRQSAFTMIEIMVATVIMVVLTGLVIQITSEVLKVWNRSSGKLASNAEARIAMDLLTQDLEAAVFRNNGLQWLRSEKDSTSIGTNTVALRLFAPALDRPEGPGDICAIAYQLENRDPVSGSASQGDPDDRLWILYRMVASPEETFDNLMGIGNQDALPDKDKSAWDSNSIVGSNGSNYLVRNVVNFEVDFHVQDDDDSSTATLVTDADGTIYGGQSPTVGPQAQLSAYQQPLAYAEIRLTIVSDEGAQLLQNITKIPETEEEVIRQQGEVFTRRVNLLARPL